MKTLQIVLCLLLTSAFMACDKETPTTGQLEIVCKGLDEINLVYVATEAEAVIYSKSNPRSTFSTTLNPGNYSVGFSRNNLSPVGPVHCQVQAGSTTIIDFNSGNPVVKHE